MTCSQDDHLEQIFQCQVIGGFWDYYACDCIPPSSPILIDLNRNGFSLTDAADGVRFDVNSDGSKELIGWTSPGGDDAFLVLDRNGNGSIDDGRELFGDRTDQRPSEEPNGFLALAVFDEPDRGGNGDGLISSGDSVFVDLRLWTDVNHNGRSEAAELLSLATVGISSIQLDFKESRRQDQHGNLFRYRSKVIFDNNTHSFAYDVFFVHP